jgi:hypothetical protein
MQISNIGHRLKVSFEINYFISNISELKPYRVQLVIYYIACLFKKKKFNTCF